MRDSAPASPRTKRNRRKQGGTSRKQSPMQDAALSLKLSTEEQARDMGRIAISIESRGVGLEEVERLDMIEVGARRLAGVGLDVSLCRDTGLAAAKRFVNKLSTAARAGQAVDGAGRRMRPRVWPEGAAGAIRSGWGLLDRRRAGQNEVLGVIRSRPSM